MYKEEEIEDSLAFCRDIKIYYEKSEANPISRFPQPYHSERIYSSATVTNEDILSYKKEKQPLIYIIVRELLNLGACILVAFVISQMITHYVGQHTKVEGISMEATLHNNDYLIIDKLTYHFRDPERFEIIVFPFDQEDYYIKRIIGLPNETVEIKAGKIYIDGTLLEEEYGKEPMASGMDEMAPLVLGNDEYFVMGDNRNDSYDSRYPEVGPIQRSRIIGKALIRIYPFQKMGTLPQ